MAESESDPLTPTATTPASPLAQVTQATRPASPSLAGTVLADRYRLLRKVGEGGMGEVYEAQHVYIDKRVAIKTLRREILSNPEATTRFQQEARAASTIGHENIVAIEDFGQLPDGGVYMAMEYLEGASLGDRARGGAMPRGEILDVMIQVCRGLAAAHDKGIIHRDMKPENVFLARRGDRTLVKILDFGIAKVQHPGGAQPQLTQTGAVFGTPFYMSPEQALGQPLDARTDVYSVGVMLYELFAGRVPFEGDSFMAILSQHITAQPTPPSRVAPSVRPVPPAFERLILKAIAKDREQRFPSMKALGDALLDADRRSQAETLEGLGPDVAPPIELAEVPSNRRSQELQPALPGEEELVPAPSVDTRRLVLWAALGAVMVVAVVGGTMAVKGGARRGAGTTAAITGTSAGEVARPDPGGGAAPSPDGVAMTEMVLDSIPSGAKVYAGGSQIAETPDAIKIPAGKTLEVLLHKEGFISRQLTLDPAHDGRKVMVKLERDSKRTARSGSSPSPGTTPSTAPLTTERPLQPVTDPFARPSRPPAPVNANPPVRPPSVELYAPLPPPPRRPAPSRPAPLDPYAN